MSAPSPQFVAVPIEVLAVARDHLERMALMDLACMADEARWEPFMASERYLVERWKMLRIGSTKVRRLLAGLVEAGWLRIVMAGQGGAPRLVRLRRSTEGPIPAEDREAVTRGWFGAVIDWNGHDPVAAPCVYFAQAGQQEMVKIGMSGDVGSRLPALQTACPHPLRVLDLVYTASMASASRLEAAAHEIAAKHRLHGEWFALSPAQVATVVAATTNGGAP